MPDLATGNGRRADRGFPRTPNPVLLVPGWSNRARALRHLARYLFASGWPRDRVRALDFADPFGSNVVHAREIARAVETMLALSGAGTVDIIAHSMGGLAARRYLVDHATDVRIRRIVFLATPHRGTWAALFAFGEGRREMLPGSRFLRSLGEAGLPDAVEAIALHTRLDLRVLPHASAVLEQARNRRIPLVTHQGLLRSRRVHQLVCDALLAPESAGD